MIDIQMSFSVFNLVTSFSDLFSISVFLITLLLISNFCNFADQMKKVFVGYAWVVCAGIVGFGLSRFYIHRNKNAVLAARERIHRESLNQPETEDTPLAFRKEYRDKHKISNS